MNLQFSTYDVQCPKCNARAGDRCTDNGEATHPHQERIDEARRWSYGDLDWPR